MIIDEKIIIIPRICCVGSVFIFRLLGMSNNVSVIFDLYSTRPNIILSSNDKKAARVMIKIKLSNCIK